MDQLMKLHNSGNKPYLSTILKLNKMSSVYLVRRNEITGEIKSLSG